MDQDRKEKIARALVSKGVKQPCPRCTSLNFEVVGQTNLMLNENPQAFVVGGPTVPTVVVACSNCGFITLHALGVIK